MAKGKNKGSAPAAAGGKKKGGIGSGIGMLVMGVPLVILFLPTVVLLIFAMLPTAVAFVVERGKYRYGFICVGGLNFAGVSPYLLNMWFERHDITMALDTLSNVFALMMIYGAAAFGWLIYTTTPSLVGSFLSLTSSRRIAALKADQRKLIEEWGTEVMQADEEIGEAVVEPKAMAAG
ncbi:MAG: hypothetical protein LDL26_07315 [Caenispirillum bisanense]|nr:hypothetical protein [Caenispirillum bisanense]MCA1973321.1 hypothetical protein [Caenispirillum sp.]